jgi:hypothetical protein
MFLFGGRCFCLEADVFVWKQRYIISTRVNQGSRGLGLYFYCNTSVLGLRIENSFTLMEMFIACLINRNI